MHLHTPPPALNRHRQIAIETSRRRNDAAKFQHAFSEVNGDGCGWNDDVKSQAGWTFKRDMPQREAFALATRSGASSNAYPPYLPAYPQPIFECRAYARKPKGTGLVKRGRTAGLPRRHQTDTAIHLTWQDLAAVYDALTFADDHLKTPLTAFLTINWRTAPGFHGANRPSWSKNHTRVVESMKEWLRSRGVAIAFIYVRERCRGPGAHTHFLLHIPRERWAELTTALEHHLHDAGGFTEASAVHIARSFTPGMIHRTQRLGVLQYVAKGINPAELIPGSGGVLLSKFLGIDPKPQVRIPCKRVGWSENIGAGAREQAGHSDTSDMLRLAASLPLK